MIYSYPLKSLLVVWNMVMYMHFYPFYIGEMIQFDEEVSTALKRTPFICQGGNAPLWGKCSSISKHLEKLQDDTAWCEEFRHNFFSLYFAVKLNVVMLYQCKGLRWIKKHLDEMVAAHFPGGYSMFLVAGLLSQSSVKVSISYTPMQLLNSSIVEVENYQLKWE